MEEIYFVIHNGEGEKTTVQIMKKKLIEAVSEKYWGPEGIEKMLIIPTQIIEMVIYLS